MNVDTFGQRNTARYLMVINYLPVDIEAPSVL